VTEYLLRCLPTRLGRGGIPAAASPGIGGAYAADWRAIHAWGPVDEVVNGAVECPALERSADEDLAAHTCCRRPTGA
jgi:hypothetical protein